jgi:hypothetical protein
VCVCVVKERQQGGGPNPNWVDAPQKKN